MYICDRSRSVGAGSATTRNTRGLTRSVMALIVPPFPAVSRPSKTMQTLAPVSLIHSCIATSSPCRRRSSFWYSRSFIFAGAVPLVAGSVPCLSCFPFLWCLCFVAVLPTSSPCCCVGVGADRRDGGARGAGDHPCDVRERADCGAAARRFHEAGGPRRRLVPPPRAGGGGRGV